MRDEQLLPKLLDVYEENYSCYGLRKMWHAINNEHAEQFGPFARCTVERLMHIAGIDGLRRKRKKPKTRSADPESCPMDLVDRQFTAQAPCKLWVANITHVPIQAGWVYAMFILDVSTRDIVGWQVINHMRESLARDALMMALARTYRVGKDVTGLVHHSDRGVQFRSIRYGQALAESTVITSVGSRGDSYDSAMAETSTWVGWYNSRPGDGLVGGESDDGALRGHLHGARAADEVFASPVPLCRPAAGGHVLGAQHRTSAVAHWNPGNASAWQLRAHATIFSMRASSILPGQPVLGSAQASTGPGPAR